jgi:hypothetical protein
MKGDNRRAICVQYLQALKDVSCCERCKRKDDLTFHHRDPKEKAFEIADARRNRKSIPALQKELDKCDILCVQCHKLEHEELLELPVYLRLSDFTIKTTGSSGSFVRVKIKHLPTNTIFKGEHGYSRRQAHDMAVSLLLGFLERN